MQIEKSILKTEALFSEDRTQRFWLKKEWDSRKKKAAILMTNPSNADLLTSDYTTLYILNNILKLGEFGSIEIINMTSLITTKLDIATMVLSEENISHIVKSAERCDRFIIAWGKIGENNKKVRAVQDELLEKLLPYSNKLCTIADQNGGNNFHPLAPQIRTSWILKDFVIKDDKTEPKAAIAEEKETATEPVA